MAIKTYGRIRLQRENNRWIIGKAQPHVCIKIKSIFPKIDKGSTVPFDFINSPENAADLLWFMERYPLEISEEDQQLLIAGRDAYEAKINEIEQIFFPDYIPQHHTEALKHPPRNYQLQANDLLLKVKNLLLADDLGLGKTVTAIIGLFNKGALPAAVTCQSHLTTHWIEQIQKFTDLKVHVIQTRKLYSLPPADVYIFTYTRLQGWIDVFVTGYFKFAVFDEISELRHVGTSKYSGAREMIEHADCSLGLSATPVYNYGDEIFNILNILNPGCLGDRDDFLREWATPLGNNKYKVKDPKALGTYLRDNHLMLRRTREDVGMELPAVNTIIREVEYDVNAVNKEMDLMKQLAITLTTGSFQERGEAGLEIDLRMRQITGISKAVYVAEFCKILLENGEPVLLAGWHRKVYEIWAESFKDYNPVWYTGSESIPQKNKAKADFCEGRSNLMIISLTSGIGLDGLQYRCSNIVYGELHYSPKVQEQLCGRIDRPGQTKPVTAFYPVSTGGSDPAIMNILGLKASQSHGIVDPYKEFVGQYSDESRIKLFAEAILNRGK